MRMEAGGQQQYTGWLWDLFFFFKSASVFLWPRLPSTTVWVRFDLWVMRGNREHEDPSNSMLSSGPYQYIMDLQTRRQRQGNVQKCMQMSSLLPERASLCVLVSGSVCHARTDEEEVEVWEAEMDDGAQTIWRGAVMRCTVWGKFGVWGGGGGGWGGRVFSPATPVSMNNLATK